MNLSLVTPLLVSDPCDLSFHGDLSHSFAGSLLDRFFAVRRRDTGVELCSVNKLFVVLLQQCVLHEFLSGDVSSC